MHRTPEFDGTHVKKRRLVYICDWLPPDFGAVGQYAMLSACDLANKGWAVTLVGLTSGETTLERAKPVGQGTIEVIRVHRPIYNKQRFGSRVIWTVFSNLLLLRAAFGVLRRSDAVVFTGSPPLMLHFIAPLNVLVRKRLIYRISDFFPECFIAERGRRGLLLDLLLRLTNFWRRRVDTFEVLGLDQARRLAENGIAEERVRLSRNPSPVAFPPGLGALPLPRELQKEFGIILYSGNWGVAHDENTFVDAYSEYRLQSKCGLALWLNAVGAKADRVEIVLRSRGLPVYRSRLVPLEDLARLLLTADVHLITLRDAFVGYVLPSKVHACIETGRRILFVGSESSDIHRLASGAVPPGRYHRVDVGDVSGLVRTLFAIEHAIMSERDSGVACVMAGDACVDHSQSLGLAN
jgi:hypothetical protein